MSNNIQINIINENLKKVLKFLIQHIKDSNTDAHEFYPEKIPFLEKAILELNTHPLSLEILIKISNLLDFKRIFPLIELTEKIEELENTVFKDIDLVLDSYNKNWEINKDKIEKIKEKYKLILIKFTLEGIFRKGIVISDQEAWASIMFNMGGRTIYKYIYNVINGWLHEDVIKIWFEDHLKKIKNINLISFKQNAHDSDRVFKFKKLKQKISGEPDFLIKIKKGVKKLSFQMEVQHVTDNSRKKRKNLIQVPSHRISESTKHGKNYLLIIPYLDDNESAKSVCIVPGPLIEDKSKKNFISGKFINPNKAEDLIEEFIKNLS